MEIYLIRHADALPLGEGISEDAERPLSPTGKAQAQALTKTLNRQGIHLELVLTSPLQRARETVEEMLRHWQGPAPAVEVVEDLGLDGSTRRLFRTVRKHNAEAVALVGHQPSLGLHTAWLIGSKKANIDLAKAGVAYVHCVFNPRKGDGSLVWLITPAWFDGAPASEGPDKDQAAKQDQ